MPGAGLQMSCLPARETNAHPCMPTMDSPPSPTSTSTAASQPRAGTQSLTVVHPTVQVRVNGSGVHNPEMRSAGAGAGGGLYYEADVPGDGTCFHWSVVVLETASAAAAGRQPRWVFLALVFGGVETLGASACGSATVLSRSVCPGLDAMTCNVHTQLTSRRFASVVELKKLAQTALLAYGSEEQDRYLNVALPFADGISAADKHRLGQLGRSNWPGLVTELLKPGVYGGHAVMAAVCLATDSNIIIHRPKPGDGLEGKHLQSHAIIRLETGDKKPEPTWLIADTFDFEVGAQPSHGRRSRGTGRNPPATRSSLCACMSCPRLPPPPLSLSLPPRPCLSPRPLPAQNRPKPAHCLYKAHPKPPKARHNPAQNPPKAPPQKVHTLSAKMRHTDSDVVCLRIRRRCAHHALPCVV